MFTISDVGPLRGEVTASFEGGVLSLHDGQTDLQLDLDAPETFSLKELRLTLSRAALLDEGHALDEVRERQRMFRLSQLLWLAVDEVPYYRERFEVYDPGEAATRAHLEAIPLLRRADLRGRFPDGFVPSSLDVRGELERGTLELLATSGTTDERLQVLFDTSLPSLPLDFRALWGIDVGVEARTVVFASPTCMGPTCHLGKMPMEQRVVGGNTLFFNSADDLFSLSEDRVREIAQEWNSFQPELIMANPVYLHWLLRCAERLGIVFPAVKAVLSTYQYLARPQRRALERAFGVPVFDVYAATDLAGCRMAVSCPEGRVHVREDHTLLEVVEEDGRPTQGVGQIAASTLEGRVMPLVRYLPGDLGRLTGERCSCRMSGWPVIELHGRLRERMQTATGPVTLRQVDEALGPIEGIDFYQLHQESEHAASLRVIPAPGQTVSPESVSAALAPLGLSEVRTRVVKRLDPEPSLKFRLVEPRGTRR